MLFAIDIDGTIAYDKNGAGYAYYLNRTLSLDIPEKTLINLKSYRAFTELPEIVTWVTASEEHKRRYRAAVREAQYAVEVQCGLVPIPGAVEGVNALARYGKIIYVTCRYQETRQQTQNWLKSYGFPGVDRVYCCENYVQKCMRTYDLAEDDDYVTFIDDHALDIIRSFKVVARERPDVAIAVLKRFAFMAFGVTHIAEFPQREKFRIYAVPSWAALAPLIEPGEPVPV